MNKLILLSMGLLLSMSAQEPTHAVRVGVGTTQRRLTLNEAVEMALKNNLDLEVQKVDRAVADKSLLAQKGVYDPVLRYSPSIVRANTPTSSSFAPASGKQTDTTWLNPLSVSQKSPWYGGQGSVAFEDDRYETNNPFTALSPYYSTKLSINYTQPLFRNFKVDRDRTELRVRAKAIEIAKTDLELRTISTLNAVEQAYWNLVAAREDVQVSDDFVGQARLNLGLNKRQIAAGTLAPVELAASEAELQRRIDTYYQALNTLTVAENVLKTLVAGDRGSEIWNEEIIPADTSAKSAPSADELRTLVDKAMVQRPELKQIAQRLQQNDYQKAYSAEQRKPQIDVVVGYAANGLGGSVNTAPNPLGNLNAPLYERLNVLSAAAGLPPISASGFGGPNPIFIGGNGRSLSKLFTGSYSTYQAAVNIDLNLRNRTADANYGTSLLNERRLKLQAKQAEQSIQSQVRDAMQGVESARSRITAAEASARAAQEKLDSETRLFQTGESTNFLVLTRQNELNDSRRRLVVARLELNRAVAQLEVALGETLATYSVVIP